MTTLAIPTEPKTKSKTRTATKETPAHSPLWPLPLEVIGLTGDFASGKTLFGLTIAPGPDTLCYDLEKSSATYQPALKFERVDVPTQFARETGKSGDQPKELFMWWLRHMRAIPAGKHRVIMMDPVSEVESGLVAFVRDNPQQFGYTAAQFARAQALVWGAVKDYWKALLVEISGKCETFVFTSHLKREFAGDRPTLNKVPKGKETLMELASLYLWLERPSDKQGARPAKPSAIVLKSRLTSFKTDSTGELIAVPTLPPRIPVATPAEIRRYMECPPDPENLTEAERHREHVASETEIETLKLARAEAEREAAALQLESAKLGQRPAAPRREPAKPEPKPELATQAQLATIGKLKADLTTAGRLDDTTYRESLKRRGVDSARAFTVAQADDFIQAMKARLPVVDSVASEAIATFGQPEPSTEQPAPTTPQDDDIPF